MSLDSIVNITITVQGRAPEQRDVGTPMLVGFHTAWVSNRSREYEQADDMLDDGFTSSHYLYLAARAVKAQNPAPARFKIGRRATALTQTIDVTPTITTAGYVYSGTIGGEAWSVTVQSGDLVADVCDDITAAINALTGSVATATDATTKVTVAADVAGSFVEMTFGPGVDLLDVTTDTTTDDELAAIAAEDSDWYGVVVCDSQSKATALNVAGWVEAQKKIAIVQTADSNAADSVATTDTLSALKSAEYARTGGIYHRAIGGTEWLAAGWLAKQLAEPPGSATPAFKSVAGVSTDKLSTAQANAILAKNGSYYQAVGGLAITYEGKSGSGEFLDTTRFVDWQFFDMQDAVFGLFANAKKVPFTNTGVAMVTSVVGASLLRGVAAGGLSNDPSPVVSAPKVADVSAQNRINRRLPDVKFEATLAGGIHATTIRGVIAV